LLIATTARHDGQCSFDATCAQWAICTFFAKMRLGEYANIFNDNHLVEAALVVMLIRCGPRVGNLDFTKPSSDLWQAMMGNV
jgi:hypothetical protein